MSDIQKFDNFRADISRSILWQYSESTNILELIRQKQRWYDVYQSNFWQFWTESIFSLVNADTVFSAEIWSLILDVPLLVSDLDPTAEPSWGFNAYQITNLSDTSVLSYGMSVSGTGISPDSTISLIKDATTINISHLMTTDTTELLTFALEQEGGITSGSAIVTGLDTSVLSVGMDVAGVGIPAATTILNIIDLTSITLSDNATATGTETLTFSVDQNGDLSDPGLINNYKNYEQGNFSSLNQNLVLTLEEEIFLLRLRYFQLTTLTNIADIDAASPSSINNFLDYLCTNNDINYPGTIYIIDNLDMTATYHFTSDEFSINLFNVLLAYDIFPRPAGVGLTFTGLF